MLGAVFADASLLGNRDRRALSAVVGGPGGSDGIGCLDHARTVLLHCARFVGCEALSLIMGPLVLPGRKIRM